MSHAHNPNSLNINLGNILGKRASVAQSARFREQMRGGAMAAAMSSPVSERTSRTQIQDTQRNVTNKVPIILTHRGGQQTGGTVWENTDYWQRRKAQKRAKVTQRDRSHLGHQSHTSRPNTYPQKGIFTGRGSVPRLSLNVNTLAVSNDFQPPLHRRGGLEIDEGVTRSPGQAGRELLAGQRDYGDSLKTMMEEQYSHRRGHDEYIERASRRVRPGEHQQSQKQNQHAYGSVGNIYHESNRRHDEKYTSPKLRTASSLRQGANARLEGHRDRRYGGSASHGYNPRVSDGRGGGGGSNSSSKRPREYRRYSGIGQKTSRVF